MEMPLGASNPGAGADPCIGSFALRKYLAVRCTRRPMEAAPCPALAKLHAGVRLKTGVLL